MNVNRTAHAERVGQHHGDRRKKVAPLNRSEILTVNAGIRAAAAELEEPRDHLPARAELACGMERTIRCAMGRIQEGRVVVLGRQGVELLPRHRSLADKEHRRFAIRPERIRRRGRRDNHPVKAGQPFGFHSGNRERGQSLGLAVCYAANRDAPARDGDPLCTRVPFDAEMNVKAAYPAGAGQQAGCDRVAGLEKITIQRDSDTVTRLTKDREYQSEQEQREAFHGGNHTPKFYV